MANPGELDFGALRAQAEQELHKEPSQQENQPVVASTEREQPSTQELKDLSAQADTSVTSPQVVESQEQQEQKVFDLPDTAQVRIKVDGEEQIVSYGEYKDLLRKNATVTQRMQAFAKSRDEFNSIVQQKIQELEAREKAIQAQSQATNPVMEALLKALQPAQKPRDPNEIVTLGDVQKERDAIIQQYETMRQQDKEEFQRQLMEAAQNVQRQSQIQQERQQYLQSLNSILAKDEYKGLLEVSPNLRAEAMYHVQTVGVQNLAEAIEQSEDFIKQRYDVFKKHTIAQQQKAEAAVAKAKMESNDGTAPSLVKPQTDPGKKFITKGGKLDFNAMLKDALAKANAMA